MPQVKWNDGNMRLSLCFFPLVGAAVGAALALWLWLCARLHIGEALRGALAAVLPLLVTGGIHMDGFMDASDALGSHSDVQKKLEIMKDSHTGAFAVMACAGCLLLQAGIFSQARFERDALPLALGFVCSRALSALALILWKPAKPSGLLNLFREAAARSAVILAAALYLAAALAVGLWVDPRRAVVGAAALGLSYLFYRRVALRQFGGTTGDLAGWFTVVSETCYALAIVVSGGLL